jgi:hypothetical protein
MRSFVARLWKRVYGSPLANIRLAVGKHFFNQKTEKVKIMSERDEPQIGFRVREEGDKTDFVEALKKQHHIASATAFFQSTIDALKAVSDRGELVEWPLEFVTKQDKKRGP